MTNIEPHFEPGAPSVLTLTELRVLSGLSRGAALPLDEQVTIGSDFACDLILVDPDVDGRHAILSRRPGHRFSVEFVGGTRVRSTQDVETGQPFEVAGVRMVISQSDAPWDFALPVSAPAPLSDIEAAVANGVAAGRLGPGAASKQAPRTPVNLGRIAAVTGTIVVLLLVGFGIFLYLDSIEPPPTPLPPVAHHVYSEAEVQAIAAAFAIRLDELNVPAMKLVTAPQQLTVQGYVDRAAESRFESAVQELRDSHSGLKVRLDLGAEAVTTLPFEVTAAVGGSNGSVLLSDGQQLFVGAEEAGFRFLGLMGNCVNFLHVASQQKVSQCSDQKTRRR